MSNSWSLHGHNIQGHYFTAETFVQALHELNCWASMNEVEPLGLQYFNTSGDVDGARHTFTVFYDPDA